MQYSHRKDYHNENELTSPTRNDVDDSQKHRVKKKKKRNIVLDTEARHKVDRADHSLYIKFKNRSTTLHKLGI